MREKEKENKSKKEENSGLLKAAVLGALQVLITSREEIARAGENLRLAGSTYRQAGKASVLSSLGRLVDIPSRRQI